MSKLSLRSVRVLGEPHANYRITPHENLRNVLLENLEHAGFTSDHLTDDSFRSAFAFAIAEKRIAIVTPLTPEQFSAQLAATEKKRLEAELIRDRKQRNQSNRVNHSNSSDGPSQRVVGFRAAMKQRQRFVEYRQAVADCHMAVSQLAWSRRESNLAQLLAVVRTRSPDVADALRVDNSTWSAANCNRSYVNHSLWLGHRPEH